GFIWVCVLGVTSTHDRQARELTAAAVWGSTQIMGTLAELLGQGMWSWVLQNLVAVAGWVILLLGVALLAVVLLRTHRSSGGWLPRVRLRDWMEMPRPGKLQAAPVRVVTAVDDMNARFGRWAPMAAAGMAMQVTLLLIWSVEVFAPAAGRRLQDTVIAAQ